MKKIGILLALVTAGCSTNDGTSLTILSIARPNTQCIYDDSGDENFLRGGYDPVGAPAYQVGFRLINNTAPTDSNTRAGTRSVFLTGFETCWALENSDEISEPGAAVLLDCENVPADQRGFFASTGIVGEDGDQGVALLSFLNLDAQRSLFGEEFTPSDIPTGDSGSNPSRSAAWGDFPESDVATVVVSVRAQGTFVSGDTVHSQWFSFPVDIAPLFVQQACGWVPVDCGGGDSGVEGFVISADSCLPFFGGTIECGDAFTTCP